MEIIVKQLDDNFSLWHFKIGGIASDGLYRMADLSRETTSPDDWLAANQAEAQALIDSGVYREDIALKRQWFGDNAEGSDAQLVRIVRAVALVMLDEINLLRSKAGMPERTQSQLVTAIRARLEE